MSDQDRISSFNINTVLSRQAMRIKKNINWGSKLIQYQILQTNITRTVRQTIRRIADEILGVQGLNSLVLQMQAKECHLAIFRECCILS